MESNRYMEGTCRRKCYADRNPINYNQAKPKSNPKKHKKTPQPWATLNSKNAHQNNRDHMNSIQSPHLIPTNNTLCNHLPAVHQGHFPTDDTLTANSEV